MARRLLQAGARTDCVNKTGDSALHLAAINGNAAMLRLLLEAGADRSATNANGLTAQQLANKPGAVAAFA